MKKLFLCFATVLFLACNNASDTDDHDLDHTDVDDTSSIKMDADTITPMIDSPLKEIN